MTDYDEAILPVTGSKDNGKRRMEAIPIYPGASLLIIETRNLVLTIMHLPGKRDMRSRVNERHRRVSRVSSFF